MTHVSRLFLCFFVFLAFLRFRSLRFFDCFFFAAFFLLLGRSSSDEELLENELDELDELLSDERGRLQQ